MERQCPKCAVDMAVGHIPELNLNAAVLTWAEGESEKNALGGLKQARVRYAIEAFRCPQCELVEMHTGKRTY